MDSGKYDYPVIMDFYDKSEMIGYFSLLYAALPLHNKKNNIKLLKRRYYEKIIVIYNAYFSIN